MRNQIILDSSRRQLYFITTDNNIQIQSSLGIQQILSNNHLSQLVLQFLQKTLSLKDVINFQNKNNEVQIIMKQHKQAQQIHLVTKLQKITVKQSNISLFHNLVDCQQSKNIKNYPIMESQSNEFIEHAAIKNIENKKIEDQNQPKKFSDKVIDLFCFKQSSIIKSFKFLIYLQPQRVMWMLFYIKSMNINHLRYKTLYYNYTSNIRSLNLVFGIGHKTPKYFSQGNWRNLQILKIQDYSIYQKDVFHLNKAQMPNLKQLSIIQNQQVNDLKCDMNCFKCDQQLYYARDQANKLTIIDNQFALRFIKGNWKKIQKYEIQFDMLTIFGQRLIMLHNWPQIIYNK